MRQLTIAEALDAMSSDNKLWNLSTTVPLKGGMVKRVINLPWGIGEYEVSYKEPANAQQRMAVFGQFGSLVRDAIKDRIDDDAVTSRAKVAAARREQESRSHGGGTGSKPSAPQMAGAEAGETYRPSVASLIGSRSDITARRTEVEHAIRNFEHNLSEARKELRILNTIIAMMEDDNAPTDSAETTRDSETEAGNTGTESAPETE